MSRSDFMNTTGKILYGSNTQKSYSTFEVLKSAMVGAGTGAAICGSLALIMIGQDQALRHLADFESHAAFAYSMATLAGGLGLVWSMKKFTNLTDTIAPLMAGIVILGSTYLALTSDNVQNLGAHSPTGHEKIVTTAAQWPYEKPSYMR